MTVNRYATAAGKTCACGCGTPGPGEFRRGHTHKGPLYMRLAAKLVVTEAGCIEWTGAKQPRGYGHIATGEGRETIGTHRAAWIVANGPIPDGMDVCHRCDNPPCCNPEHLFLGTRSENLRDMVQKGRHWRHAA